MINFMNFVQICFKIIVKVHNFILWFTSNYAPKQTFLEHKGEPLQKYYYLIDSST